MSSEPLESNQTREKKILIEFNAGKMIRKDKGRLSADKRKGLLFIYQSDDSLMHFCWKDLTSGIVEDDLIVFPTKIETKHVITCTTGRLYYIRFKNSDMKLYFYMQNSGTNTDQDNELWNNVSNFLNILNIPAMFSFASVNRSCPILLGNQYVGETLTGLISTRFFLNFSYHL